ncbi:Protein SPEAR2 [Cardamine amara subsp. amara]|uniref:Protein SPEAR2 n=1 Tax=Cardamine amara subsp. amara TaxID=228776 RepID=A0ABD1BPY3_CARAN
MCSNNTSSGSFGDLQHDDYSGSCRKKQKINKVRRRGPGVAELEKIRLQEEIKIPSLLNINDHTLFAPAVTVSGGCELVMIPPNFSFPEKLPSAPVFPFSYGSLIPPAPVFQRKQQHSLTMNLSNPSPGVGGFYQFIEPPSNQRSCVDTVSQFLDEENKKMVNAKKPRHFHTDTSVGPTSTTILRDAIQNRSFGMRLTNPVQDSGSTICNPIAIDSPTSIPSFPRHYTRFIPLGLQYQQQQEKTDFDENMQRRSKKPFYSFLPSGDQSNADQEQRTNDRYESSSDHGIDLSLKL